MFQADQPITKCSEDKLGRISFVESLAQAILSYKSDECVVLGLFGSWGTGKTSLINMCLECIDKIVVSYQENERPIIIKFNPWNYSGQQQLIVKFFNHISSVLSQHQSKRIKEIGREIIAYTKSIFPIKLSSINLGPISLKLKKTRQKSLESQKNRLCQSLKNQSQKIIVVIDDIDRLNNYEIRQIFQVIKVLGNLPNIIYLVAFDKDIVIRALEKEQGRSGLEYLEKIVQVPFEIPPAPKEEIYNLLFSQLDELIKDIPERRWDSTYWGNVFYSGIRVVFNTIRDVTRYLNILRFSFPMVKEEVNPIDFIAITSFQVFLPELYYAIRDNKDLFTGVSSDFGRRSEKVIEEEKKQCNEILNLVPDNIKENIKELLTRLFPKLKSIWENTNYSSGWFETWRKDCRICSPDVFDTYFRLAIPKGEISQREIQTILSSANNPNSFAEALLNLNKDGRIIRFLERLEDYTRDYIPEENIETIISVLMDIGDMFPEGDNGFFSIDTPKKILRICYQLSQRLDSHKKRFEVFKNAMGKATRSLFTIVNEVSNQDQEHGKYHSKDIPIPEEKRTVNAEQLKMLEEIVFNKIETWANDGRLKKHKKLVPILFRWRKWGGGDKVTNFVEKMVKDDEGLIDFITGFLTKSKSQTIGDHVFKTHWRINIDNIKEFIKVETIEPRIREIINSEKYTNLNEKQKIALQTFVDIIDGKIKDNF
ncbi:MAG: P-loop NTPase fold protein [Endomicrobiia bacterium]